MAALCRTLTGRVIPPVNDDYWRDREGDLRKIVDQVTAELVGSNGRMPPLVLGEKGYSPMRYFRSGYPDTGSYASFGVATRFSDRAETALWLRFHKKTGSFAKIRDRIMTSPLQERARHDDGHLWLPMEVPPNAAGPALVIHVVDQIKEVQKRLAGG